MLCSRYSRRFVVLKNVTVVVGVRRRFSRHRRLQLYGQVYRRTRKYVHMPLAKNLVFPKISKHAFDYRKKNVSQKSVTSH